MLRVLALKVLWFGFKKDAERQPTRVSKVWAGYIWHTPVWWKEASLYQVSGIRCTLRPAWLSISENHDLRDDKSDAGRRPYGCCSLIGDRRSLFGCPPLSAEGKFVLRVDWSISIGLDWFSIRMGWKWVGIDGKGYANTTYISEFHPHIPAGRIFQKKGLPAAAARAGRRRPTALFLDIRYPVSGIRY